MAEAAGRRCGRCEHQEADHSRRGCLVCFKCVEYIPERINESVCVCSHTASEHKDGRGHCRTCRCRYYLLNLVLESRSKAAMRTSTGVHTVAGGAFESNRRRH
jgi:hypothetical protein